MNAVVKIQQRELATVGKRTGSIHGYRHALAEDHLEWHLTQMSGQWCSMDCMARTMLGRNCEQNRVVARRNMLALFRLLLNRGRFLVIEYDAKSEHGKITAVKIFSSSNEEEMAYAGVQVTRLRRRNQISGDLSDQAEAILVGAEKAWRDSDLLEPSRRNNR